MLRINCSGVLRGAAYALPVTVVTGLLTWSYYATIFHTPDTPHNTALHVITTITWGVSLYTYFLVLKGPGSPLDFPMLHESRYVDGEEPVSGLRPPEEFAELSQMCKNDGGFRFCSKCKVWKPDRSHHCSGCDQCVLKMDHHCPWFATCIGYANYRSFVQFLLWLNAYLCVITSISAWAIYGFFATERWPLREFSLHTLFVLCLGAVFGLCVFVFGGFTLWQVFHNRTTIESYEFQRYRHRKVVNIFDLGWRENWKAVMGPSWVYWMFPISLPLKTDLYSMGLCFRVADSEREQDNSLVVRLSGEFQRGSLV